ncbi:hypothetical protein Tco_1416716, partial [Tanacetum coccineum]
KVCDKFKTGVGFDSQVVDSQVFDSQENDMYKTSEGYHVVPPPYTRNFMPPKSDLVLANEDEYVFIWISDSEDENETEPKSKSSFAKVEFVKSNEHEKTPKECVKKVGNNKQAKYPSKNSQSPRDCDFYEKNMVENPVWNNARRVNHQNSQRLTHPHPKRNFVSRAVLMKSGLKTLNTARQNSSRAAISVTTARPINTAHPRPTVNCARPVSNVFNKAHSHVRRPFNKLTSNKNSNFNEKVNTVRGNVTTVGPKAVVSNNKGNEANAVKASACWVWRPKQKVLDHGNPQLELHDKGVIDSGCSRHMMVDLLPLERKSTTGDSDETVIKEWEDILKRVATTASSLEAEQDSGNINKTQSMATLNESFPQGTSSGSGLRCQDTILGDAAAQIRFEAASKQSNDPPLSRVNTLGSGEDSMKLKELIELCTKMPERALDLA